MKKIIQDKQLLIRRIFLMCYDVLAVFAASIVALLIRFDLNIKSVPFQYMESASFYDNCYVGHFLDAPAVFQSLELCGSTGNDVCGFSMYSGYRCCDSADIASELGGYVPGAKKLLHSVWIVSVCICHGMQIFLPRSACASQYAQSRCVQTEMYL